MSRVTHTAMAVLLVWLAALAARPAVLFAVEAADLDPDLKMDRSRRLGRLHVQPYLRVKQAGYDDNVFLQNDRREGAFTATLGPGLKTVLLAGRRAAVMVADDLEYVYFSNTTELNHFNNALRAKLDVFLGRFLLYADTRHESSRERLNAEVDFRVRHSVVGQAVGVKGQFGNRITAGLQAGRQDFRFGSAANTEELAAGGTDRLAQLEVLRALERVESEASAFVAYRVFRKTTFGIARSEGRADFEDPRSQRDARSRRTYFTMNFSPSAFLTGSVRLGRYRLDPEERPDDGFDGSVAEASLGYRISGRGRARLQYGRDVVFSIQSDNLYFITEGWRAAYAHAVSDRWSFELEHGQSTVDYPRPITLSSGPGTAVRSDRITINALAGLFRVQPGTRVGLRLEQWSRASTFGIEEARRNVLSSFVEFNY